jgi:cytochrome P450
LNANANPALFWLLLRVYSDSHLLTKLRSEIAPFAQLEQASSKPRLIINVEGLQKSCPWLKASYLETMRYHVASDNFKYMLQDVVISESRTDASADGPQSFLLPKGEWVLIPHISHQMNSTYFPEPKSFKPERWLRSDKNGEGVVEVINKTQMWPFSGGAELPILSITG